MKKTIVSALVSAGPQASQQAWHGQGLQRQVEVVGEEHTVVNTGCWMLLARMATGNKVLEPRKEGAVGRGLFILVAPGDSLVTVQ